MGNFSWTSPAGGQFMNHSIRPANENVNRLHPLAFPDTPRCTLLTVFLPDGQWADSPIAIGDIDGNIRTMRERTEGGLGSHVQ